MADRKPGIIRRDDVVVVAVDRKARVNFPDLTRSQFEGEHLSPAVINQEFAILRPVGGFDDIVEFLEHGSLARVYVHGFEDAVGISLSDPFEEGFNIHRPRPIHPFFQV